jgi:hypothetical protein
VRILRPPHRSSFRGASFAREPGIHSHNSRGLSREYPPCSAVPSTIEVMDSGLGAARRPGMTKKGQAKEDPRAVAHLAIASWRHSSPGLPDARQGPPAARGAPCSAPSLMPTAARQNARQEAMADRGSIHDDSIHASRPFTPPLFG